MEREILSCRCNNGWQYRGIAASLIARRGFEPLISWLRTVRPLSLYGDPFVEGEGFDGAFKKVTPWSLVEQFGAKTSGRSVKMFPKGAAKFGDSTAENGPDDTLPVQSARATKSSPVARQRHTFVERLRAASLRVGFEIVEAEFVDATHSLLDHVIRITAV
jgi:hypothetical protein